MYCYIKYTPLTINDLTVVCLFMDYSHEDMSMVIILVSFSSFHPNFHCYQLGEVMKGKEKYQ